MQWEKDMRLTYLQDLVSGSCYRRSEMYGRMNREAGPVVDIPATHSPDSMLCGEQSNESCVQSHKTTRLFRIWSDRRTPLNSLMVANLLCGVMTEHQAITCSHRGIVTETLLLKKACYSAFNGLGLQETKQRKR
jgi:hypothetical protein